MKDVKSFFNTDAFYTEMFINLMSIQYNILDLVSAEISRLRAFNKSLSRT